MGKTLENIFLGNAFQNRMAITQETRVQIDKWDCNKLKSFCMQRKQYQNG
jgi:hypothetical protein